MNYVMLGYREKLAQSVLLSLLLTLIFHINRGVLLHNNTFIITETCTFFARTVLHRFFHRVIQRLNLH